LNGSVEHSQPALGADGTLYIGAGSTVYAVRDGAVQWKFLTDGDITTSPCISPSGTLYVGTGTGALCAVRGGMKVWEFKTLRGFNSSPVLSPDGTLYAGNDNGMLYAFPAAQVEEQMCRKFQEMEKLKPPKPDVDIGTEWIIIDGVRLPVKKNQHSSASHPISVH